MKAYDKAIELDPKDTGVWILKARALETRGRYDESLEAYERAIELDPAEKEAWKGKGNVLKSLGRDAEAEAALTRSSLARTRSLSES
jgi:tetratricopeptide (TPR) repeat protein